MKITFQTERAMAKIYIVKMINQVPLIQTRILHSPILSQILLVTSEQTAVEAFREPPMRSTVNPQTIFITNDSRIRILQMIRLPVRDHQMILDIP